MSQQDVQNWSGKPKTGMPFFSGPQDVRDAFIEAKGIDWTASYIDSAEWIEQTRVIVPWTTTARARIRSQARNVCGILNVTVSIRVGFQP